jgi:glutamate-5-semialdehyde dehydrogenase
MTDDILGYVKTLCGAAKAASASIAGAPASVKNKILLDIKDALVRRSSEISAANGEDLENAEKNGVPETMLDRLKLDSARIGSLACSVGELAALADPVGGGERWVRPNGLEITRVRVPLGTVGIIYEARPNVTADAASICIKTGNACVLRGGKEAINSNRAIVGIMRDVLSSNGIDPNAVSLIENTERGSATALMQMRGLIDVLIPRGGAGLIRSVVENARVPVIETGAGNCHLYVDASADLDMAVTVAVNAKTSRPSVCNAIETLLVHRGVATEFLPRFAQAVEPWHVEIRGCAETAAILPGIGRATDDDYHTEYNDYIIAVRVVDDIGEAIAHINKYNTGHSEAIITRDYESAARFKKEVDAAAVYVNASTRFTDGGEFGFGAEIGISTQKLHARGPMGLYEMTTVKYFIEGNGQTR